MILVQKPACRDEPTGGRKRHLVAKSGSKQIRDEIPFGRAHTITGPFRKLSRFFSIKPILSRNRVFERASMAESADEEASIQASIPGERIWGPVPEAQAVAAGALAAASSVLIAPQVAPVQLYQRLTALVPDEVLPKASDTAHTLRLRLAASAFLHPSQVSAKGHGRGGRYVALNDTTYPQPRRVQWATPTVPEHTDPDGDRVVQCLCYPHYYTKSPLLRMVEVMPPAIDELITFAVQLARPVLTPPSLAQRPNSCELCIYYTAFGSKIGRHRDNFVSHDLTTYLRTRDASVLFKQQNAQLANSNVLILSLGNAPMVLQLSFPGGSARDSVGERSTYVVHPLFSVPCGFGTLFVFSATDDLFYCHEAFFEPGRRRANGGWFELLSGNLLILPKRELEACHWKE